ncbi:MAG: hypothetical protein EZS28_042457, partial [Streblomastix strix]
MTFAHILADIFVVLGVIFLLSLLGYLILQFIIRILKPLDLKKRNGGGFAFITGGNSGMCEQFAKEVNQLRFYLAILAEDEERLNKVAKVIINVYPQCHVIIIKADLSDNHTKVTEQVITQLPNEDISIMFFNAGYGVVEVIAICRGGVLFTASLDGFIYPPGSHHDRKELAKSGIILETMYVYECPKDAYLNSTHW